MKTLLFLTSSLVTTHLFAQLISNQTMVNRSEKMNYYLYSPPQQDEPYPLMVYLHGGGASGDNIELLKRNGPPKHIAQGKDFPFYIFAPQNPYEKALWDDRIVNQMVDHLVDSLNIDSKRIYLAGLSRGGYGVWRMAINYPDKFAAMISICAASIPKLYINRIPSLPVWFFHGEKDNVVPVSESIEAYERMSEFNSNAKLTIYPEAKHDSWSKTFENDKVYEWLLSQSRK